MSGDQPSVLQFLIAALMQEMLLSEKSAAHSIEEYGDLYVRRRAMYCLWMMRRRKVHVPPA